MEMRRNFSEKEWLTLQLIPFWVFTAIAGIEGKIDVKDIRAFADELQKAKLYKNPFVREVLTSIVNDISNVVTDYKRDEREVIVGLIESGELLEKKVSADDGQDFKLAMVLFAISVVEASRGKLGEKDQALSAKIKEVVALIAAALKLKLQDT